MAAMFFPKIKKLFSHWEFKYTTILFNIEKLYYRSTVLLSKVYLNFLSVLLTDCK